MTVIKFKLKMMPVSIFSLVPFHSARTYVFKHLFVQKYQWDGEIEFNIWFIFCGEKVVKTHGTPFQPTKSGLGFKLLYCGDRLA